MQIHKGNTLIPAVIVILAISATVGVYAFSVWPTDKELNVNTVRVTQPKNTNSSVTANTNIKTVDATKDWKTYTNTRLGYYVKYPGNYKVTVDTDVVRFDDSEDTVFDVNYRLEAVDGSLNTWFDTSPTGDAALGGRVGKKFIYRYCDGPGCGSDTVAFVVQHKDKLLGLEFLGDKNIDSTEQAIFDGFNFTK